MSRSNNDKPFYVDVVGGIVAVRCTSNHDIIVQFDHSESPRVSNFVKRICDRMNKEAEKPIRNCDAGTAEDQAERFKSFCNSHPLMCDGCPLNDVGCVHNDCAIYWAQMPYEEVR